jgi:hypothetical protein
MAMAPYQHEKTISRQRSESGMAKAGVSGVITSMNHMAKNQETKNIKAKMTAKAK